ncbi:hypothetical protein [Paenibacillus sp. NAIST15-1]|uniref:hypothetical protein n=1 Tax=Paenibacillus sp. NAIST15-1 TaxID=1605994 RepID=UPI0015880D87|nr:hypothetical protein [Paenibacillus sp. NAIST15-1]
MSAKQYPYLLSYLIIMCSNDLDFVFCTICPPLVAAKELTILFVVVNKFYLVPTPPGFTANPATPPVKSAILHFRLWADPRQG